MAGILSLDSLMGSGNDSDSTDTSTSDDSDDGALKSAIEAIGGDVDHARDYVSETNGDEDDLIEFAGTLASDEELWAQQEEYRRMNDINRIIRNWLRGLSPEFTAYTGEFYGDSSDPEPGCYNDVQQTSRDIGGNLMWYRAIFPEPVTEYWDSDPVLWYEFDEIGYGDDQQDSHIYVTEEFVGSYSDFAREIDGQQRPCPPSNDQLESGAADSGSSANPDDLTEINGIGELFAKKLNDVGVHTHEGLAAADTSELAEKVDGASENMVEQWQDQVADSPSGDSSSSEQADLSQFNAEKVEKLVDAGFSRDEVLEMLG